MNNKFLVKRRSKIYRFSTVDRADSGSNPYGIML
jgi:hypothetical protein